MFAAWAPASASRDTEAARTRLDEGSERVVACGGAAAHAALVEQRHLILMFAGPEDAERIARDVGGAWMLEHIVPLLADGTDRCVGELVASAHG